MTLRKAPEKFCPRCGEDITDTYESYDPDTGIMSGGWYCEPCELPVPDEEHGQIGRESGDQP